MEFKKIEFCFKYKCCLFLDLNIKIPTTQKKEERNLKKKKHTHTFIEIHMVKKHEIKSYMRPNYCIYHNYNLQDLYLTVTLFNLFTKVLKAP